MVSLFTELKTKVLKCAVCGAQTKDSDCIRSRCREEPPISGDPSCDFYFHSLSAIYGQFTVEQIGCAVANLWNVGVRDGTVYENRRRTVRITRDEVARKHRTPASNSPDFGGIAKV